MNTFTQVKEQGSPREVFNSSVGHFAKLFVRSSEVYITWPIAIYMLKVAAKMVGLGLFPFLRYTFGVPVLYISAPFHIMLGTKEVEIFNFPP